MPLIEVANLSKSFGEVDAVKGIYFNVAAGEIFGLVGPDAAGKTTTMRLLCGAYHPSSSHDTDLNTIIQIAGFDVITQTEQARAQIGYLPQRFTLYEELTVLENIRFFAESRGIPADQWQPRCIDILTFVGLSEFQNRRAGHLSGGMKQKLGLAAALVHDPRILLLDEPTTGVDPVTRQDFWQLIIRLVSERNNQRQGTAILVSTPYMDEAARCSRIGFMKNGNLLVVGTPTELRHQFKGQVLELIGRPLPKLRRLSEVDKDVQDVQLFGDRLHLHVPVDTADQVISRLTNSINNNAGEINSFRKIPPQLEDVFINLAGEGLNDSQ